MIEERSTNVPEWRISDRDCKFGNEKWNFGYVTRYLKRIVARFYSEEILDTDYLGSRTCVGKF